MNATWGTPTLSELRAMQDDLAAPYVHDTSIKAQVERHRKVQSYCRVHGQAISDLTVVGHLVSAIAPCGIFSPALTAWTIANSIAAIQTFEYLATAMLLYGGDRDRQVSDTLT